MLNETKANGHTEPMTSATDAHVTRIERRLAEIAASGEQRVLALRDAVGEFVDGELTPRDEQIAASNEEIATLKKRVADLEHKVEQQAAVVQQIHKIATRLEEEQERRDRDNNSMADSDFVHASSHSVADRSIWVASKLFG